ncbi:MAG TPA: hypothetical protein VJY35_08910 [Candidatus Eisenbacteria bacterium]|nr:hypothetical protein [Candidatus Eisenbacteria bacterium]
MTTPAEALFGTPLLEGLHLNFGKLVDVHAIAADTAEMVERKRGTSDPVRSPVAMLVSRVRKAALVLTEATGADPHEIRRYAVFHAETYRLVANGVPPPDIAARIERARANGLRKLNPMLASLLREYGESWPKRAREAVTA